MATKSQIQKMMKKMQKHQKAIADERDKLDDSISEMEALKDDCYDAWEALESARDALSRLA